MGIMDSISATQSRIEVLRRTLQLQKSKKEESARIISQQLKGIVSLTDFDIILKFIIHTSFMSQLHAFGTL